MRYRINLYREREGRAGRVRRGLMRSVLLGLVAGLEILLIGALAISGFQLQERARDLRTSAADLSRRAEVVSESRDAQWARQLVEFRLGRVDWSTTLQGVSAAIPRDLILFEIKGSAATERGGSAGLDLNGFTQAGAADLDPVMAFIQSLRADSTLAGLFPFIALGTAQGQQQASLQRSFQIVCRPQQTSESGEEGK